MNSSKVSELFPDGTVIVAYKGQPLGGTNIMPKWKIEPLINENRYFRSSDGLLAKLAVSNSITLEFDAVDPRHLYSNSALDDAKNFDSSPGELSFIPFDPEKQVAYYFPLATLKNKSGSKKSKSIRWKFEILFDNDGVFMKEFKADG